MALRHEQLIYYRPASASRELMRTVPPASRPGLSVAVGLHWEPTLTRKPDESATLAHAEASGCLKLTRKSTVQEVSNPVGDSHLWFKVTVPVLYLLDGFLANSAN
jgi:hypothetical protein